MSNRLPMQNYTIIRDQKIFRQDRGWLAFNAIVYTIFVVWAAEELMSLNEKTLKDYGINGLLLFAAFFGALIYWKSYNLRLIMIRDRIIVKGWFQQIEILFTEIDKCEFYSPDFLDSCIVQLKKPISPLFRYSPNLPLKILKKDRTVISLSSFFSEKDWPEFEKVVCQNLENINSL